MFNTFLELCMNFLSMSKEFLVVTGGKGAYGQNVLSDPLVLKVSDSAGTHTSFPGAVPKVQVGDFEIVLEGLPAFDVMELVVTIS